jgi:diketogulonate reductase-like aldo/keto reductase
MFAKSSRTKPFLGTMKRFFGTSAASSQPYLTLNTGARMPAIAFGTWKTPRTDCATAVSTAIENGYRNIDAANDYNNEDCVGEGLTNVLSNNIVSREDLFVQAKLWNTNHRAEHVMEDLEATLDHLNLDYLDSFVIHWPQAAPSSGDFSCTRKNGAYPKIYNQGSKDERPTMFPIQSDGYFYHDLNCHYIETWVKMQECVTSGKVRSIGVSNFTISQINEIIKYSELNNLPYKVPALNQVECHPYLQQKDLLDYCRNFGITFQAFSVLGSGATNVATELPPANSLLPQINGAIPLENEIILSLGKKYNKSAAQVILRWALQRGISFVSKSANVERIKANMNLFDFNLSDSDMNEFDKLNIGWRHLLWAQTSKHPDYPFKDWLPYDYELEKAPTVAKFGEFTMEPTVAAEQAKLHKK